MSDRFKDLKSSNPSQNPRHNSSQNPSQNPRQNPSQNPRQNPSHNPSHNPRHNPSHNPRYNPSHNPRQNQRYDSRPNYFKPNNLINKQKINLDLNPENFPILNITEEQQKQEQQQQQQQEQEQEQQLSYIEKIKLTKQNAQKQNQIPPGWTILKVNNQKSTKQQSTIECNPNFNPDLSMQILYYREMCREELNNIVGDISQYWNMTYIDDDYDDDDYDDYYDDDSNDDNEYFD